MKRENNVRLWLFLLLALNVNSFIFTHSFNTQGLCKELSPEEVYGQCLEVWRTKNVHLPLIPPVILSRGHEESGVGLEILRISPLGLIETIVDCGTTTDDNENTALVMTYMVKNPGWFTLPVERHQGRIKFSPVEGGTKVDWMVQWTPLPFCGQLTMMMIESVIHRYLRYTTRSTHRQKTIDPQVLRPLPEVSLRDTRQSY